MPPDSTDSHGSPQQCSAKASGSRNTAAASLAPMLCHNPMLPQVAKELGLQIGKSDAPQLAVERAAAGKGRGGRGKKAKEATPAGPPPQQAQHDPIKVLRLPALALACTGSGVPQPNSWGVCMVRVQAHSRHMNGAELLHVAEQGRLCGLQQWMQPDHLLPVCTSVICCTCHVQHDTPICAPASAAVRASIQVLLRIGGRMLGGGADAEASGPGSGAEAPSPQPKGGRSQVKAQL